MKIIDLFNKKKPVISFEIFPAKSDTPLETILGKLDSFSDLKPDFMSVTYGAGGSEAGRTVEVASNIKSKFGIEAMAHFTCVGHNSKDVDEMLETMKNQNLNNILALRGDPPQNQPDFDYLRGQFPYASDLVKYIKSQSSVCIAAAAYPEGHYGCERISEEFVHLKNKVDSGVDFLVTQLFFDNRIFYDFSERALNAGINCPITPGIMPVFSSKQILRITELCRASIPAKLVSLLDKYRDNDEDMTKAGIEYASRQIENLIKNGARGIHFLTMNRPKATKEIMKNVGLI